MVSVARLKMLVITSESITASFLLDVEVNLIIAFKT